MSGPSDAFIQALERDGGDEVWTYQYGTSSAENNRGIDVRDSLLVVVGQTFGALGAPQAGAGDLFVLQLPLD